MQNRWINDYALRYAVGTILGAAILAYIFTQLPTEISAPIPDIKHWGASIGLLIGGLAFCYIASAPLLVFHAARWMLLSRTVTLKARLIHIGIMLIVGVAVTALLACRSGQFIYSALTGSALILILFQLYAYIRITFNRDKLFSFYVTLASKRNDSSKEIVESYRTLREHGNAYSIVVMEVALGMFLVALIGFLKTFGLPWLIVPSLLLACALWVAPGALILATASRLELDFVQKDNNH